MSMKNVSKKLKYLREYANIFNWRREWRAPFIFLISLCVFIIKQVELKIDIIFNLRKSKILCIMWVLTNMILGEKSEELSFYLYLSYISVFIVKPTQPKIEGIYFFFLEKWRYCLTPSPLFLYFFNEKNL